MSTMQFTVVVVTSDNDYERNQELRRCLTEGIGVLVTENYGTGSEELHGFEEVAATVDRVLINGRLFNGESGTVL